MEQKSHYQTSLVSLKLHIKKVKYCIQCWRAKWWLHTAFNLLCFSASLTFLWEKIYKILLKCIWVSLDWFKFHHCLNTHLSSNLLTSCKMFDIFQIRESLSGSLAVCWWGVSDDFIPAQLELLLAPCTRPYFSSHSWQCGQDHAPFISPAFEKHSTDRFNPVHSGLCIPS